jgi:hypothetical protein
VDDRSPDAPAAAAAETSTEQKVLFKVIGTGKPSIQYGSDSDTRDGGHLGTLGEGNALPWSATLPYTDGHLVRSAQPRREGFRDVTLCGWLGLPPDDPDPPISRGTGRRRAIVRRDRTG